MAISAPAKARRVLDARLARLASSDLPPRPPRGWVRAVRDALGMSSSQLASRLGVDQSTVTRMEQSEAADTISLATLRRAAAALDCTLVYALVPRTSLEDTVQSRARRIAEQHIAEIEHTMALEAQGLDEEGRESRVEEHAAGLRDDRRLWQ